MSAYAILRHRCSSTIADSEIKCRSHMKKMRCELCKDKTARILCEPDHAYLCWDCDATVHSANFLVARHSRNLLCHRCRSPIPWGASGPELTPTLCLCQQCLVRVMRGRRNVDEREAVEAVPWSPPPPDEEESTSEESNAGG